MKLNGNGRLFHVAIPWSLACVGIAMLALPAAYAQQQPAAPDQYQGVSQPPPDDTIVATPDTPAPAAVTPKPSPYVTVPPPPATSSTPDDSTPAPSYQRSDAPVITNAAPSNPHRWDNTDYGIVTVPVAPSQYDPSIIPPNDDTAVLHVRDNSTQFASRSGYSNQLPAGTQIRISIAEALSTADTPLYAPFHGRVMVNVMRGGSVIIPAGSMLRGRVVEVSQGHHFGPAATLRLRPDMVVLPDGTAYHIYAEVEASDADDTRVGSEGAIKPASHTTRNSVEYGVGVGSGAIVGAALGGPPGALAGTIIGAGIVTTHLLIQHPNDAAIPAGSDVTFGLTQPLYLIPTRN
ncbi:MAG: hypothetical protein ACRD3F_04465 [Acidobacteriaceae bacterium]